jgi:hypothetical protein
MKFRKKRVVIEAFCYDGNNGEFLRQWSDRRVIESPVLEPCEENPTGAYVQIDTLEGHLVGHVGDWIIRGVKGEFYPCKPDIFAATYEVV